MHRVRVLVAGLLLSLAPAAGAQAATEPWLCQVKRDIGLNPITPPVRKGSWFEAHSWADGWYVGNVRGGPTNVRIHTDDLGPPCGA
ncbi:hypothetical protein ACFOWZ_31770 [Lentzea rhizosphaerae]|uniref:Peptidase inhibitor family I36 n=1 Tax=Lentzea rhizosphaerae TaxID=2041025 RepID=A0ABV8C264_9PSEU